MPTPSSPNIDRGESARGAIPSHRLARQPRHDAARGFTLLELMVVVIIVGILAVMAIPSMSAASLDRRVYENAANIQDLIREARARAIGRGGAVMVSLSTKDGPGEFRSYELKTDVDGGQALPLTSCKAPSNWTDAASVRQVGNASMNTSYETTNRIKSIVYGSDGATAVAEAFLCFTPAGRTYYSKTKSFDGEASLTGALRVQVARYDSSGSATVGIVRQVLIPPSGGARLVSGVP